MMALSDMTASESRGKKAMNTESVLIKQKWEADYWLLKGVHIPKPGVMLPSLAKESLKM